MRAFDPYAKYSILAILLMSALPVAAEGIAERPEVRAFIQEMVVEQKFDAGELQRLFEQVAVQGKILEAMDKPAEAKPWYAYRKLFITEPRIRGGLGFWEKNAMVLERAKTRFGVPPEIIVAILGIETSYGQNTGNYRVIDALSTLAFDYPKRADFFRHELTNFLLLCRDEHLDANIPKGSYAGAMGLPQFMPSSYRQYAVDLDDDHRKDIWTNAADAIGSVGRYLQANGWHDGETVVIPAQATGTAFTPLLDKDLKPTKSIAEIRKLGIQTDSPIADSTRAKLIALDEENGPVYWLTLENFYVITRYNHSPLYAMAVYELSRELLARRAHTAAN